MLHTVGDLQAQHLYDLPKVTVPSSIAPAIPVFNRESTRRESFGVRTRGIK